MSVLLTGGAGYIGSHIAVELLFKNYEVIIADNYSNSSPDTVEKIKQITGKSIPAIDVDLTDLNALEAVFASNSIDSVIHLAGFKAVGESVKEPLKYYGNNLISSMNLLKTMLRHEVGQLVFSSSATVYGSPDSPKYTEDMPAGECANPYGSTKHMIERIITDTAAAHSSISAVLLRYFNPIGAHSSGLIGDSPNGIPNNLMPYITQVAAGKLPYLNVYGGDYPTHDGTGVRDYVHVSDLARGHVSALEYCRGRSGVETFNLGTGRGYSVFEIIKAFERVNNIKIPYQIAPRREGDLAEYYADTEKAKKLMGWQAELTLEDMCRDAWTWERGIIN